MPYEPDDLEIEEYETETNYNQAPKFNLGDGSFRTLPAPTE